MSLGRETDRARELYRFSGYGMPRELIEAGLLVKQACAETNRELAALDEAVADAILAAIAELRALADEDLAALFPLDPFQGGAGTAFNMNLNEAIASLASRASGLAVDPFLHVNLHQSTNDVVPTAVRLMMLAMLFPLEESLAELQERLQEKERRYAGVLATARTQLRDATVLPVAKQFTTWACAVQRDRWRIFKARERLKEVNLGGTAVGSGLGAPRSYVLRVVTQLQRLTPFPVSRADDLVEATSNWDQVVEAMGAVSIAAGNLRRMANDWRLLASGPLTGFGELILPKVVRGSSIMPGKVNPVVAEAAVQIAERILANQGLIERLAFASELQLNAFAPMLSYTIWESLSLLSRLVPALERYAGELEVDEARCAANLSRSQAELVALLPLLGYETCERLAARAAEEGKGLEDYLVSFCGFSRKDAAALFAAESLTRLGYDEALYRAIRERNAEAIDMIRRQP